MTQQSFQCGHIDPRGGESVENLKPICQPCNGSMGQIHMDVWMKRHGYGQEGKTSQDDSVEDSQEEVFADMSALDPCSSATLSEFDRGDFKSARPETKERFDRGDSKSKPTSILRAFPKSSKNEHKQSSEAKIACVILAKNKLCALQSGKQTIHRISGKEMKSVISGVVSYEHNRELKQRRAQRLATFEKDRFAKEGTYSFCEQSISLCDFNGTLKLIDGQHRLRAWEILEQPEDTEFMITVFICISDEEVQNAFARINSGTPVPRAYYNRKALQVVRSALDQLEEKHHGIAGESKHVKRPKYYRPDVEQFFLQQNETFINAIMDKVITDDILYQTILEVSDDIYVRYRKDGVWRKIPANITAWSNAQSLKCYLGIIECKGAASNPPWVGEVVSKALTKVNYDGDDSE